MGSTFSYVLVMEHVLLLITLVSNLEIGFCGVYKDVLFGRLCHSNSSRIKESIRPI